MIRNSEHPRVVAAIRRDAPPRPGVYTFYDAYGKPIYIGKSVNLRQRLLSYFRASQAGLENRLRQMVFNIHRFDFHETSTELIALLLEDVLIKRELPAYNIRQREYGEYRYLRLTEDAYPACRITDHQARGTGLLYGPFRDQYLVADIASFVNRRFQLRSCTDPVPSRKCLDYDLGLCLGPCRGELSAEEYAPIVGRVVDFLEGDESWIEGKLQEELASCVESGDYDKAAVLKAELGFSRCFCRRQRFFYQFKTTTLSIHERDDGPRYQFARGNLVRLTPPESAGAGDPRIPELLFERLTDERFILDRANLIYLWLSRQRDA